MLLLNKPVSFAVNCRRLDKNKRDKLSFTCLCYLPFNHELDKVQHRCSRIENIEKDRYHLLHFWGWTDLAYRNRKYQLVQRKWQLYDRIIDWTYVGTSNQLDKEWEWSGCMTVKLKLTSQREACRAFVSDLSSGSKTVPWPITRAKTWANIVRFRESWSYARGRHCLKPHSLLAATKCARPVMTSSCSSDSFCETWMSLKRASGKVMVIITDKHQTCSMEPSSDPLSGV